MAKRESRLRPTIEKLGFTVPEAAAPSSLDQTSIYYKAIKEGQLRICKYSTPTIITRAESLFLPAEPSQLTRTALRRMHAAGWDRHPPLS